VLKTGIFVKTLQLNVDITDAGHWPFSGHQSVSGSLYTSKLRHNSCTSWVTWCTHNYYTSWLSVVKLCLWL